VTTELNEVEQFTAWPTLAEGK